MDFWEYHYTWNNNPFRENLVLFTRYIDYILIIWDGSDNALNGFIRHCESNPYGREWLGVLGAASQVKTLCMIVNSSLSLVPFQATPLGLDWHSLSYSRFWLDVRLPGHLITLYHCQEHRGALFPARTHSGGHITPFRYSLSNSHTLYMLLTLSG